MPVVTMPNGDLVQFPDSMSREQIGRFIASKFPGVYDKPEPAIGDIFASAMSRGGINLEATLKDELPAYLASIFGQDEYAKEQLAEAEQRRAAAAEQYPTQYGSFKDVESIGDVGGFIAEKFAENVPILAGLGGAAITGAVAAPFVGVGAATGASLAGALGSYSLMAPESFAGIYAETGKIEPAAASIAGAVNSALELVAPVQLVRSFSPSMRSAVVAAALKKSGMAPTLAVNAAKGVVKGAATEGLTEGAQESVNIAAENFVSENPEIFTEENISRVLESTVAGAAVGVPLGFTGGVGRGFTQRAEARRLEEEQAAAQIPEEVAIEEPVVAEQAALEAPATVIPTDKAALNKWGMAMLGIAPNAKIIRPDGPLAGKDLTDPAQAVEVKTALEEYLKTAKNEEIINKVKAVIRDLEPTGTFAAEPVVAKKEAPKPVAQEPAIDEELATQGLQKTEVQDETVAEEDIPVDRPLWSKDLLGFLTDEYDITEAQAAGLTQIIADEVVEEAPEEVDGPSVIDEIAKERDAVFAQQRAELDRRQAELQEENEARVREELKAQEEGRVLEGELVGRAGEATQPRREGITSVLEGEVVREGLPRPALTGSETVTPQETTPAVEDGSRVDVIGRAAKKATTAKKPLPTDLFLQLQKQIDKENAPDTRTVKEKKADQKVIRDEALEQADIEQAKLTKGRKPRFGEDALAFRNKELPEKVYRELAVLKAATTPKKEATDGRQILANYLHAYKTPEGALAAIAAESNIDYAENTGVKLATTVVDAQKAGAYINKNMDESVKNAFKKDVDFVTKELDSIERRNAKEKKDAEIRKKSKFGRSKTAEDLKDVGAGTKGAKAVAKKKKEEVGETPEQIAKRIKDEEKERRDKEKARRDEEAEATADLELDAEQEGTVGFVASVIRNAQGVAEKTEAELGPKSRNNEWVKFIASLPKTKQKTFLDSYTRISKENPNLIPESVRARVVAENKKILSQKDQKRLVKFEEKFLLETPEYQGPELDQFVKLDLANNDLQTALDMVANGRNARGEDKNITALIRRIRSKVVGTKVVLDGPGIRAVNLDPLRSEALEVQAGVEGKSAIEAAKFVAKNAPSKDLRVIATAIQNRLTAFEKAGLSVDFKVIHLGDSIPRNMQDVRGFMDPNVPFADGLAGKPIIPKPLVRVMGADITGKVGVSYEVVTHELFHAVTSLQINNVGGINDAKTTAAVAELNAVRNRVVDSYNERLSAGKKLSPIEKEFSKGGNNFLENPREFITWAMTNRGAAEYLDTIPYQNTTALTAFVRALRKLFGLETTQDTALTEVIKVTEVLLGKNAVNAAMRKAQAVEGAGIAATTLPNMASGAYIPGLNTIVLSTRTGLNEHTLLHESGHAGLAQILNNRNHPTTKKFIEFFDEIKTRMGDAYGGSDIQEFAAEFVSNGEFQALLKQIKSPKGDSLWTRVIKAIAEFFGLRKTDTAYDTTLKFLNDLLDVSQGIEPTLADTLYLGNGNVDAVMDDVADTYLSRSTEDALDAVSRLESDKGRVWALGTASLGNMQNMFGETSPRYKGKNPLPIGTLLAAIERKRGEVNTAIDRTSKNIREMSKAERDATPAQRQAFNDIAIDARLESVDFLKPLPKNAGPKKAAAHKKLNNRFNQLPKPLQASYRTLRKELDTFLEEYVELISQLLPETAASNLMKDFAQLEGVIAYVPFERTGEYWIRYKDPDNLDSNGDPRETPRALASPRKREIEIAKLKAKHGQNFEVQQYDNLNSISVPKGLPEGQFVTKLVGEMRNSGVDEAIVEQVYQQYVSMFPENSLMQQFKKSKNDPGMDRDIVTAYSNVAIKWANKIANTRYNPQIETAMQEIRRVQKEYHGGDKNMAAAAKALTMQEGFFLNPRVAPWAANLTFASYFEYILGSVSSAVVNLTGLMFMVTPMLGARTTYTKAGDAMLLAGKLAASKNWREGKIEGELSKYKNLYRELDNRGLLQHTVAREALERGKTKGKDFDGVFYKTVEVLSIPFAASEKYMRATTAIAAYDLAMANGIPSENVPANNEQAAIDFAAKMVRDAHTGGMAETMPRWLQNDFGRVVWTFKNIVFQQAYVLATAMKQAFLDSDLPPEVKRVARRQVMGTFGLSFALLGGKGLPFFGALTTVMSIFDAIFGDDEEPYDPRVELSDTFGSFFYDGLIGSLLNINISERAALARDIVWRDDPKSIEDYGYLRTWMMALGGPMFSYGIGVEKALTEDFPQGRYMRGFEGLSPTFFRNGLKSIRYMEEGARNRDGDPIDTDINAWNLMTQAIGFTPADLSNTYEQRSSAKNFENKVLQRKQRILNKYKTAKKMGDKALQEEAVKEAREFRRKFPTLMDDNTLERSYKASVRVDREDTMAGITFTKGLRYKTEEFFE
jgi:hypothetical protein